MHFALENNLGPRLHLHVSDAVPVKRAAALSALRGCDRHRAADRIYAGCDAAGRALRIANGNIAWVGSGPGYIIKDCRRNCRAALLDRKTVECDELLLIARLGRGVVGGCRIWRHRNSNRATVSSTASTECPNENQTNANTCQRPQYAAHMLSRQVE